jgi:hypothetical protein
LNLIPGEAFEFNLDKWMDLQFCGLYRNLTAKPVYRDGGVSLEIKGYEVPSITFQPELSASLSLTNPQVSGGVSSFKASKN